MTGSDARIPGCLECNVNGVKQHLLVILTFDIVTRREISFEDPLDQILNC